MAVEDTVLSQYSAGFKANLNLSPQQKDCRLLPYVDGDLAYDTPGQFFNADDVGQTDPEIIDARVPNTPDKFINMTRRVGVFVPFQDAQWIDNVDKARELTDPTSKIMEAMMAGLNRHRDVAMLTGLLGNAFTITGPIGSSSGIPTAVAFPSSQVVLSTDTSFSHDAEVLPTDGSEFGLSIGKLIHAKLILDESELEGERCIAVTSFQIADLLRHTPTTSEFFTDVRALVAGKIDHFMGFKFVEFPTTTFKKAGLGTSFTIGHDGVSPIFNCPAWIEPALVYRGRPITEASVFRRPDKSQTPQAFYKAEDGAVRRYDTAVVSVQCYTGPAF